MRSRKEPGDDLKNVGASLRSMTFSLFLVVLTLAFVVGLKYYCAHHTYDGPKMKDNMAESADDASESEAGYMEEDKTYKGGYLMIQNVKDDSFLANPSPDKEDPSSRPLKNGQILKAEKKGTYKGNIYYCLEDGFYVKAGWNVEPLLKYVKVSGYVVITYISSKGVKLRQWADFNADNVAGAAYVGDKVAVKAKVETVRGDSAYITDKGYYITTNTRYLNDYTNAASEEQTSEKQSQGKQISEKQAPEK